MYLFMVSSASPTVLTQYPRLQKCSPVTCLFSRTCLWIQTALFPLMNPMANATLCFGGMLMHIWIWSAINCLSIIPIPHCQHTSRITSPTRFFISPYSFLFWYLGIMTTWYLQSHRTWDKLCHSCISSSPSLACKTFPEEEPNLFFPGSV